jgi:hypothetical protein
MISDLKSLVQPFGETRFLALLRELDSPTCRVVARVALKIETGWTIGESNTCHHFVPAICRITKSSEP